MEDYKKYLDPKVLNKISNLELKARLIVEGYISGLHRSPYYGFSVEFAEHREYVPGDDIRHIDWKVYGKSDRYYIKQYEEETNLIAYIIVDCSASMSYKSQYMSKYEYSAHITASLSYLITQQQDSVGLFLIDKQIRKILPPSSNIGYLKDIAHALSTVSLKEKTNITYALNDICERIKKRGLVIIISDFFDEIKDILTALRHFRHKKHDVIIFHILDHDELYFPLKKLTRFEDLEDIEMRLLANPKALRKGYLEELNKFIKELKSGCIANRIDYSLISTDQPLDVVLSTYLATRARKKRR